MMKIDKIWEELESDKTLATGLLFRRYSADVSPNIYIALRQPERQRCLALQLGIAHKPDLASFSNLKGIRIEFLGDHKLIGPSYLMILLLDAEHRDVFSVFCEDLIAKVSHLSEEKVIVQVMLNRLEMWRSLFDKATLSGLSPEEQRGLYGELYFIRRWINNSENLRRCVMAWVGPEKQIRDFQLNDWGVEVKTTQSSGHQKIQISSARQLDTTTLNTLYLFHLSLEVQQENGETLNQIVDDVAARLQGDVRAYWDFRSKLILAGYFNHHTDKYKDSGYQIRSQHYYSVNDAFPRIEESELRRGVGDVKYSIILSESSEYETSELKVFETIE